MGFDEEAVDSGCYGGAGKGFEVLAGSACRVGRRDSVLANGVGGVKHYRVADLLELIKSPRIHNEVVVAKSVSALGENYIAVAGRLDLGADLGHRARSHHLPVLEVDRAAGAGGLDHQGSLHAEVGRNLQNVYHLSHRRGLVGVVNVGKKAESVLALDLAEDAQALVDAGAHVVVYGAAVVFLKAGFVNNLGQGQSFADAGEVVGHPKGRVERFNDAGSGD